VDTEKATKATEFAIEQQKFEATQQQWELTKKDQDEVDNTKTVEEMEGKARGGFMRRAASRTSGSRT